MTNRLALFDGDQNRTIINDMHYTRAPSAKIRFQIGYSTVYAFDVVLNHLFLMAP